MGNSTSEVLGLDDAEAYPESVSERRRPETLRLPLCSGEIRAP